MSPNTSGVLMVIGLVILGKLLLFISEYVLWWSAIGLLWAITTDLHWWQVLLAGPYTWFLYLTPKVAERLTEKIKQSKGE